MVRPPLSLLEPMALGRCLVTSFMKGNEEIIKNGENGLMINFDELNRAIFKIKALIRNPQQRKSLGQKARKTIQEMYSPKEYEKVLKFYSVSQNER